MFPDIETENRCFAVHVRAVLVCGAEYLELAVVDSKPSPAAAKTGGCCFPEQLLELIKAAKGAVDSVSQRTCRLSAAIWAEYFPEQAVVGVTAAVVANSSPD